MSDFSYILGDFSGEESHEPSVIRCEEMIAGAYDAAHQQRLLHLVPSFAGIADFISSPGFVEIKYSPFTAFIM